MSGQEEEIDLDRPPVFDIGTKVRSRKYIKNDGTFPGREIGEILVKKGDVGYVRDIGSFLQRFHIFAVDFIERGVVVGMKAKELEAIEESGK